MKLEMIGLAACLSAAAWAQGVRATGNRLEIRYSWGTLDAYAVAPDVIRIDTHPKGVKAVHIAGDGAFSLGMIAEYMDSLVVYGASFYRNLFWEAGLVGQVLYLEAEEAGIRSTGIGCYFDDPVHEVFGISSREWQSFYHFTVGGPVEDGRLTTLPAYDLGEAG